MNSQLNKINNETISVIMAVYNCENTVSAAIESIINQSYQDFQLIICNDCSTDRTAEIVKEYSLSFPEKIVFIENDKNLLLPSSLNHCLKYAKGKYIARMDGDDYSYPDRFEQQVEYLREHPNVDLVGTAMEIFDGENIIGKVIKKDSPVKEDAILTNPFSHGTIMTYKYVYDELNGYSLENRAVRVEDYDLWIRFFSYGFIGKNITNICYRALENSSTIKRRKFKYRVNGYKTAKYGVKQLGLSKTKLIMPFFSLLKGLIPRRIYVFLHKKRYSNH